MVVHVVKLSSGLMIFDKLPNIWLICFEERMHLSRYAVRTKDRSVSVTDTLTDQLDKYGVIIFIFTWPGLIVLHTYIHCYRSLHLIMYSWYFTAPRSQELKLMYFNVHNNTTGYYNV